MDVKVSILIPCYNAERWISQAVESALNQTYSNKEVIVIDDGSTDNSLQIIKTFGDRLQWETQENRGGNHTRNRLLALSTGEWLQYLDSDDYLQADKIEKQVRFLSENPDTDIIYSPSIYEYNHGDGSSTQNIFPISEPHDPWILLARWFLPQTGSPLWRKQAIIDVGGWKIDQPCCQEHELYLRLLKNNKQFAYCPETGSVYRQWSEETVCKQNKPETQRRRLAIKDNLEAHLQSTHQLTPERQQAINQARFECARQIWLFDKPWATEIMKTVKSQQNRFLPSGEAAPSSYLLTYQLLGFNIAENLALVKRKLTHSA